MRPSYVGFYLDGREDVREGGVSVDVSVIALAKDACADDGELRTVVHAAATAAVRPLESERTDWIAENKKMLKADGYDGVLAFDAFQRGRIDELAHIIEPDVTEAMEDELDGIADADEANEIAETDEETVTSKGKR